MILAQTTIDSLADRVATRIRNEKKSFVFPKVVVVDFADAVAGVTSLSSYVADRLDAAMRSKLPSGSLMARKKLGEFLGSQRLSPLDLQSISVAYWAADNVGANEIVFGEMAVLDRSVDLTVKLLRIGPATEVATWKVSLPPTDEIRIRYSFGKASHWNCPILPTC